VMLGSSEVVWDQAEAEDEETGKMREKSNTICTSSKIPIVVPYVRLNG
jgi:hypothetical protein